MATCRNPRTSYVFISIGYDHIKNHSDPNLPTCYIIDANMEGIILNIDIQEDLVQRSANTTCFLLMLQISTSE